MPQDKISLQKLHTFSLPAKANKVIFADTEQQIISAWQDANNDDKPFLLLGEGSNVLFLDDFSGTVVFNRIKGISVAETDEKWQLHVGAGENWHNFVSTLLEKQITGLENLALIPGCVGSAPIQNIGAYGIEINKVCSYVDLLDLTTQKVIRINARDCQFGYRESIFKHQYREGYAIVAVGFSLTKKWQPVLSYGELKSLDPNTVTPKQIYDTVCHMRRSKLPDPMITGNAGSFFKNPVVSVAVAESIQSRFTNVPVYPQPDGTVKLAAGWLIDQCQLKGVSIGGASVHQNQALVIINNGDAVSQDVADLAYYVRSKVAEVFAIWLEPEVRFIDKYGEVSAVEYLS